MEISEKLKEKGWHLSKEGLEILQQNTNSNDINSLTKKALEIDLREISCGSLPSDIAKSKHDSIDGDIVVQITKLRNVSAPKINQDSKRFPRLLKLTITDGKVALSALELEHINGLSIDTPPGTKLYLKNGPIKIIHNYVLLRPANTNVLGGLVPSLVEKWELERNLSKYAKGTRNATSFSEIGCPPPWVPFGKRSLDKQGSLEDAALKSIQKFMDEKSQKATEEFEALRKENIQQALKDQPKKSFGGGKKKLVDSNVQKIMDGGFSQAEAENALKYAKYNVERALKNLQYKQTDYQNPAVKNERFEKRRGRKEVEESKPSSGKISLSDFLEDKLPKPAVVKSEPVSARKFEENVSQNTSYGQSATGASHHYQKYNQNNYNSDKFTGRNKDYNQRPNNVNKNYNENTRNHYEKRNDNAMSNPKPYNNQRIQNNIDYRTERLQGQKTHQNFTGNDVADVINKTATMSLVNESANDQKRNFTTPQFGGSNAAMKLPAFKSRSSQNIKGFQNKQTNDTAREMINTAAAASLPNNSSKREYGNQDVWKWRIGDRCLAKYWEDKKYYNAEVTGVSINTCVVRFLEYENFEEINKADCLPITEEKYNYPIAVKQPHHHQQQQPSPRPNYNAHNNRNNISNPEARRPPPPFGKKREDNSSSGNNIAPMQNNHRNNRPMRNAQSIYVPPAQRN